MTIIITQTKIVGQKIKTIALAGGGVADMWVLFDDGDNIVSLGVPQGRDDIADFIIRSCKAGQTLLRVMPPGMKFTPDEGNMSNAGLNIPKPPHKPAT